MATKQITTWDEFISALRENVTENTTYELMNDIELDEPIEQAITIEGNLTSTSQKFTKTFEGLSHKINNIHSYINNTSGNLIAFSLQYASGSARYWHNMVFNDIHFSNIMLQGMGFISHIGYSVGSVRMYTQFNRCLFNGLVYRLFYGNGDVSSGLTLSRCSINIQTHTAFSGQIVGDDNYTIVEPYQDICDIGTYGYYNSPVTQWRNSYFGGTVKYAYNTNNYIYLTGHARASYYTGNPNVINCNIIITNYNASTTYLVGGGSSSVTNGGILVNKSKIFQSDGETPIPESQISNTPTSSGFYLLSDSELKSKSSINEVAPTFPIWG